MPGELGEHGERMWRHVTPELVRMGILGQVDLGALEIYCRLYQEVRDHPGGRGFGTLATSFLNAGSKLGLDPAARLRMTLPEARDDEEDAVFGTG
jgi:phage terminase small subunit